MPIHRYFVCWFLTVSTLIDVVISYIFFKVTAKSGGFQEGEANIVASSIMSQIGLEAGILMLAVIAFWGIFIISKNLWNKKISRRRRFFYITILVNIKILVLVFWARVLFF